MRLCKSCRFAVCVDCFFATQLEPYNHGFSNEQRRTGGETKETTMRQPTHTNARTTARVAIIELRSLLVADAPIKRERRDLLIRKAITLARSSKAQTWAAERLHTLIEERFAESRYF